METGMGGPGYSVQESSHLRFYTQRTTLKHTGSLWLTRRIPTSAGSVFIMVEDAPHWTTVCCIWKGHTEGMDEADRIASVPRNMMDASNEDQVIKTTLPSNNASVYAGIGAFGIS